MTAKTRNRLLNVLKVVVSLGVLAVLASRIDLEEVVRELGQMRWLPFLAALGLFLAGALVRGYRWGVLVWALGVRVSWWRLVSLYFVGAFFGQFLPTGVGGDAVKMYELSRDDHRAAAAISSVLVDRFLGLFVLFAMALVALAAGAGLIDPRLQVLIAIVFAVSLVAVFLILQRSWLERVGRRLHLDRLIGRAKIVRELYESLHLYGRGPLLRASAASVVWNLILILGYFLLGQAVGIDLPIWYYFLLVPIISALLLLPSVGGLGVREGGTVVLFVQAGAGEVQAAALAGAYLLTNWATALIGAILYVLQGVRDARG